ncbi:hypothetical protein [Sphingomonas sp. LH128]|uniref:hypothetical protein n=1 Tax=Sphingomonas sp. LH128 TaxID=473781 RepID=UPI0012E9DCC0|nr:hypothetical protein [Sphingomonas sp. LH128]
MQENVRATIRLVADYAMAALLNAVYKPEGLQTATRGHFLMTLGMAEMGAAAAGPLAD